MAALRRGAALVKRATVPAACFGTGYFCCWKQGHDETAPELLACSAVVSWAGFARGLRHLRHSLPDGAEWPKEKLAQAESSELRTLARAVTFCQSQDLASTMLHRLVLQRICAYTSEEGRGGLGVQGLAPVLESPDGEENASDAGKIQPRGSGLAELVSLLDASTVALTSTGCTGCEKELLQPLVAALGAVVADDGSKWQQELDPVGVLQITDISLVGSSWLAESLRSTLPARREADSSAPSSSAVLSAEDHDEIGQQLTAVWQALAQSDATPAARSAVKGFRGQPEASELLREVDARFSLLQALPQPPPQSASRPLQDALPSKLVGRLREAMAAGQAAKRVVPARSACIPSATEMKPSGGIMSTAGKLLEYAAWIALLGGAAVAISSDGLGLLSFHVVPESLRPQWQAVLHQRALRVEELFTNHDPGSDAGNGSAADCAPAAAPWGAQSTYIQGTSER